VITLHTTPEQHERWKRAARAAGLTLSEWIRQACDAHGAGGSTADGHLAREMRRLLDRYATVGPRTAQGQSTTFDDPDAWTAALAPSTAQQRARSEPATPAAHKRPHWQLPDGSVRDPSPQELAAIQTLGADAGRILELPSPVLKRWQAGAIQAPQEQASPAEEQSD